ncbi:unnamed protein product [Miscanthus lutarioriparius]|uniref:Uncharacterized protein n=1 Tax=Miscanthus lutarioriparius TaxID=422564 RepID=A0A811MC58_9POAL|nr:unnamed protein product [Miscanthus lutarioriparius]
MVVGASAVSRGGGAGAPSSRELTQDARARRGRRRQAQCMFVHAFSGGADGSSESGEDGSDGGEPEPKRRRLNWLGSNVVRSAAVLARTLVACEEKRERQHREVLELEERRLRLVEERTEVRRQGFAGLVSAVNSLSSAIHALVSDHRSGDSASRQNQCNDKWDNLLRDYESRATATAPATNIRGLPSYWSMEQHQRKNRNLPY